MSSSCLQLASPDSLQHGRQWSAECDDGSRIAERVQFTGKARIQLTRPDWVVCMRNLCQHLLKLEHKPPAALLQGAGLCAYRWRFAKQVNRLPIQQPQGSCPQGTGHLHQGV